MPTERVAGRGWSRFVLGYLVLWGVLAGISEWDATGRWGIVILLAVAVTALAVERLIFGTPLAEAVSTLGLGRPNRLPFSGPPPPRLPCWRSIRWPSR